MVSDRVLLALRQIADQLPDGDAESSEPLLAAWADVRIGIDDADELLAAVELSDWVVDLMERHGEARGRALLRTYIRLLSVPGTMETLQMIQRNEVEQ